MTSPAPLRFWKHHDLLSWPVRRWTRFVCRCGHTRGWIGYNTIWRCPQCGRSWRARRMVEVEVDEQGVAPS